MSVNKPKTFEEFYNNYQNSKEEDQLFQERPELLIEKYNTTYLTPSEIESLRKINNDENFIHAMDELKNKDIIEFTLKIKQFEQMSTSSINQ